MIVSLPWLLELSKDDNAIAKPSSRLQESTLYETHIKDFADIIYSNTSSTDRVHIDNQIVNIDAYISPSHLRAHSNGFSTRIH